MKMRSKRKDRIGIRLELETLCLSIIMIFIICSTVGIGTVYAFGSDGGYLITTPASSSIQAENTNGVEIQNIQVQPSMVKVGDAFTITITLVNNSTVPIWLDGGKCSSTDKQGSFFTLIFDNHAKIKTKEINCAGVGWSQLLDPGKNITAT